MLYRFLIIFTLILFVNGNSFAIEYYTVSRVASNISVISDISKSGNYTLKKANRKIALNERRGNKFVKLKYLCCFSNNLFDARFVGSDAEMVLSSSYDNLKNILELKLWDLDGKLSNKLHLKSSSTKYVVNIDASSRYIYISSESKYWVVDSKSFKIINKGISDELIGTVSLFGYKNKLMVSVKENNEIVFYDMAGSEIVSSLKVSKFGVVNNVAFNSDGSEVFVLNGLRSITSYDIKAMNTKKIYLETEKSFIKNFYISSDNDRLIVVLKRGISIFDVGTGDKEFFIHLADLALKGGNNDKGEIFARYIRHGLNDSLYILDNYLAINRLSFSFDGLKNSNLPVSLKCQVKPRSVIPLLKGLNSEGFELISKNEECDDLLSDLLAGDGVETISPSVCSEYNDWSNFLQATRLSHCDLTRGVILDEQAYRPTQGLREYPILQGGVNYSLLRRGRLVKINESVFRSPQSEFYFYGDVFSVVKTESCSLISNTFISANKITEGGTEVSLASNVIKINNSYFDIDLSNSNSAQYTGMSGVTKKSVFKLKLTEISRINSVTPVNQCLWINAN